MSGLNQMLIYQAGASFLVGGGTLTAQSILAEKANRNISGILLMFPSTVVVGFFFLGLTSSAHTVSRVIPSTLVPLGIVVLSILIYIHIARIISANSYNKISQIIITLLLTSVIWLSLIVPFAISKSENLWFGISGYLLCVFVASYLFSRSTGLKNHDLPTVRYSMKQHFFRALFMGSAIAAIVVTGKTFGPFWGGVFTMYPAASLSALAVLHYYYNPDHLLQMYANAPIGSLSIFVYCIAVMLLFPRFGIFAGTLFAFLFCLLFSFGMAKAKRRNT